MHTHTHTHTCTHYTPHTTHTCTPQTLNFTQRAEVVAFAVVVNTYYQLLVDANTIILEGGLKPPERCLRVGENGESAFPSTCLSSCSFIHLSIHRSFFLFVHPPVFLFIYPPVFLFVRPSTCLFVRPSTCLSFCSSIHMSFFLFIHPPVCLSVCSETEAVHICVLGEASTYN